MQICMKIQFYASLHSRDITISKIQLSDWSRPYSDVSDHIHLKSLNEDSAYLNVCQKTENQPSRFFLDILLIYCFEIFWALLGITGQVQILGSVNVLDVKTT